MIFEFLSQFSLAAIIVFCSGVIVVITLLEKLAQKEFIGRRMFRLMGKIFMFFLNWATTPIKPQITRLKEAAFIGYDTSQAVKTLLVEGRERDVALGKLSDSIEIISKEFKTNGGSSIKDDVTKLLESDKHKVELLHNLRDNVLQNTLRINIIDDAAGRMTFQMSPELDVTEISATFLRFFGWTEDDIIHGDWDLCLAEQSRNTVMTKWEKAVKKRTEYSNHQYILDSDGKEHFCKVHGYPRFPNGEFTGFFGTIEVIKDEAIVTQIAGEITIGERAEAS